MAKNIDFKGLLNTVPYFLCGEIYGNCGKICGWIGIDCVGMGKEMGD